MQIQPTLADVEKAARGCNVIPVWCELIADMETPVSAFAKVGRSRPVSFLLESVEGGEKVARYSFIGIDPFLRFRASGMHYRISGALEEAGDSHPVERLKRLVSEDCAFERYMRRYLKENLFFGEEPELRWPDESALRQGSGQAPTMVSEVEPAPLRQGTSTPPLDPSTPRLRSGQTAPLGADRSARGMLRASPEPLKSAGTDPGKSGSGKEPAPCA